jgi:hypothetical protein
MKGLVRRIARLDEFLDREAGKGEHMRMRTNENLTH